MQKHLSIWSAFGIYLGCCYCSYNILGGQKWSKSSFNGNQQLKTLLKLFMTDLKFKLTKKKPFFHDAVVFNSNGCKQPSCFNEFLFEGQLLFLLFNVLLFQLLIYFASLLLICIVEGPFCHLCVVDSYIYTLYFLYSLKVFLANKRVHVRN